MNYVKNFLTISVGLIIAILGEWLAYFVYTSKTQGGFIMELLGITAFVTILGGLSIVGYPLIMSSNKTSKWLKNKSKFIKVLVYTSGTIYFVTPFVIAIICFYHFTNKYTNDQLTQFGVIQKVKITGKIDGKSSRHDLLFKYQHEGETWDGMLHRWKYNVGDSALIIYSSENPNEVAWYHKFINTQK